MITARLEILKKRLARTVFTHSFLPAVLLVVLFGSYVLHDVDRGHRDASTDELRTLGATWKTLVDGEFRSAALALEAMAATRENESPQAALERVFKAVHRNIPWIQGAAVVTAQGRPIALAGTAPAVGEDDLAQAVQGRLLVVTNAGPGADGLTHFGMLLSPADDRDVIVCASVNAARFSAVLDGARIGRTGEVFLIDETGTLRTASVMHGAVQSRVDESLSRSPLVGDGILVRPWKGTRLWARTEPVHAAPGWRLVVQRDESEILQNHDSVMLRAVALGLSGLAILAAIGFTAKRRVRTLQECMATEHARISEHDMHVRKLDAISQLGVGIAHEVNNPLAIIGEEAGWMQDVLRRDSFRDNPDTGELQDSLRQIVAQTARSREITHKLLSFGGKTDGTIRDTDVNTLVGDVTMLRRREASTKNIEIREEPAGNLPVILSEPGLLRQLLANLITNSMDAMPQGGVITISTRASEDGGVNVSVRDTGFGIPQENLPRIFDPFFTTKPPGKGAGLGLSICHGIMQRLGGRIFAKSVPGEGTTVNVELPLEACARKS